MVRLALEKRKLTSNFCKNYNNTKFHFNVDIYEKSGIIRYNEIKDLLIGIFSLDLNLKNIELSEENRNKVRNKIFDSYLKIRDEKLKKTCYSNFSQEDILFFRNELIEENINSELKNDPNNIKKVILNINEKLKKENFSEIEKTVENELFRKKIFENIVKKYIHNYDKKEEFILFLNEFFCEEISENEKKYVENQINDFKEKLEELLKFYKEKVPENVKEVLIFLQEKFNYKSEFLTEANQSENFRYKFEKEE